MNNQITDILIVDYTDRAILNKLVVYLSEGWSMCAFTVEHKIKTSHLHASVNEGTMNGETFEHLSITCLSFFDGFKAGLKAK